MYGLAVWSNNAATGQFYIKFGPTPLALAEEVPFSIDWDLDLYNYTPNAFYWEFAGTRPDPGTNVELAISDVSTYEVLEERSRQHAAGLIEFIASDYFDGYSTDFLRVSPPHHLLEMLIAYVHRCDFQGTHLHAWSIAWVSTGGLPHGFSKTTKQIPIAAPRKWQCPP